MSLKYTILDDGSCEVGDESKEQGNGCIGSCPENIVIQGSYDGNEVTIIARNAFNRQTNIKSVSIPNSIKYIKAGAFDYTSLTQLTLPDSLEELGDYCFASNAFETITIPQTVRIIGNCPFGNNVKLKSIIVVNKNPYFCTDIMGSLMTKNQTIFIQALPNIISLSIPPTVHTILTKSIDQNSKFKSITIHGNIKKFAKESISNLPDLETIYYYGIHAIPNSAFFNSNNVKIYVCNDYDSENPNSVTVTKSNGFCYRNRIYTIKTNSLNINPSNFLFCLIILK